MKPPRCVIIAGPNGAGKTTFATDFLPRERGIDHFVNADLIAAGLSPLAPGLAQMSAGRLFLSEMDRFAAARADFGFESTLSGLTYIARLKQWKRLGYRIEIIFLWLPSPELAKARVAARVRQGGHDVPAADILCVATGVVGSTSTGAMRDLQTHGVCSIIPSYPAGSWNASRENDKEKPYRCTVA